MQIKIEKLIFGGFGLGHDDNGRTVLVKKSVPDDLLQIKIVKDKKNFAEGIIEKIIEPSPIRIKPNCEHFDVCGGCDYGNIAYSDQLKFKEAIFRETLNRRGIDTEILPIIAGSDSEFFYRNTIRFFFILENDQISLAMHRFDDFNRLIHIKKCLLQSEWGNIFSSELIDFINQSIENKRGLSQLRIREGKNTGDFMIEIITANDNLPEKAKFVQFLKGFPEIKSAYHTITQNNNLFEAKRHLLFGSTIIYEKIGRFKFQISPDSFFQTNSLGVKTLYDKIKEFADIKAGDSVLDLYCGTGSIGLYLSTLAKNVVGVESVRSAVNDATANARLNNIHNAKFICDDVEKWLEDNLTIQQFNNPIIIVDPPRQGLNNRIISQLYELYNFTNFKLLYVSCDPSTFARDIKEFEKNGLKLKKVQPIDMFPQTHHIECVGLLQK